MVIANVDFGVGDWAEVGVSVAALRGEARVRSERISELLYGERGEILDVCGDFCLLRGDYDGYEGYVAQSDLRMGEAGEGTIKYYVSASSAPMFASADIKSPLLGYLPLGSLIGGEARGDFRAIDVNNFGVAYIHCLHVAMIESVCVTVDSIIAVARRFLGCPYVWGGRSFFGIDCSGLTQAVCLLHGLPCVRDSQPQSQSLGQEADHMQAGDVLFWRGHTGIFTGSHLIHAYGGAMQVVEQPCQQIFPQLQKATNGDICAIRRLVGV